MRLLGRGLLDRAGGGLGGAVRPGGEDDRVFSGSFGGGSYEQDNSGGERWKQQEGFRRLEDE